MGDHHRHDRRDPGCDLRRAVQRRETRRPGPKARGAARRGCGRRARRLVHRHRGDRGSRLVRHAARPRGAVAGFFGTLLALRRIPVVARALAAPGLASRLEYPHLFRVEGVVFLILMALGHLPALFALPAGLGDIAAGIAAPLVAYRLARGTGRRAARWHNAFGITDLVVALTLGALTGFQLVNVTPSAAPIFELPLALIVTAGVPLLLVLHITSVSALAKAQRAPLAATGPLIAGAAPRTAVAEIPAAGAR